MHSWQGYTNKMLFHARVQLDAWDLAEESAGPAFRDACIQSIAAAFRSMLAEVIGHHSQTVEKLPVVEDLVIRLEQIDILSSEAAHLIQLTRTDTWLSSLLAFSASLYLIDASQWSVKSQTIPLRESSAIDFMNPDSVRTVLKQMKDLVSFSRNYSLEW